MVIWAASHRDVSEAMKLASWQRANAVELIRLRFDGIKQQICATVSQDGCTRVTQISLIKFVRESG